MDSSGQERRKPLRPRFAPKVRGKMLEMVNFVNFARGSCRFGRLEFTARYATSDSE